MIILNEKPATVNKDGKKSLDWFGPAKTKMMKEPKKFLERLLHFAKVKKESISSKIIKKL